MTNKIETTPSYRPPVAEKKSRPEPKRHVSPRWQEVEERRDSPKSGLIKEKDQNPGNGKKPFLSKNSGAKKDESQELSPFELFATSQAKSVYEREAEVEFTDLTDEEEGDSVLAVEEKEDTGVALNAVLPSLTSAPFQQDASFSNSYATAASPIANSTFQNVKLLEFAEKLVKKITVMKGSGKIEITLTLKNLSLFNGGILKVVEHDSAKGQYNLIFTNLNSKAHALVTSPYAERLLKECLEPKGFTCHIITATTEIEPITAFAASETQEERDNQSDSSHHEEDSETA